MPFWLLRCSVIFSVLTRLSLSVQWSDRFLIVYRFVAYRESFAVTNAVNVDVVKKKKPIYSEIKSVMHATKYTLHAKSKTEKES